MLSILAIGDQHFKVDNLPLVELFIEKIEALALEKKPDIIICLGDLLHEHERIHTIPLNKAHEFIDRLRKITLTFVLVGNHDYISNTQFLSENHWLNSMKEWDDVVIVDKVISHVQNGVKIVLTPYVFPGRFEEALETLPTGFKDANCIFAHQEFFGSKMGAMVSVDGDRWSEDYPFVISGHIHSKQTPQPNIYYSGAAFQHAFGESESNTIPFIRIDKYPQIEEIDLNLPRKKIIRVEMDDIDDFVLKETKDQVKLTLTGNPDDFKAFKDTKKYKELSKKGVKIAFKADKEYELTKKENISKIVDEENHDFKTILQELISKENDKNLQEFFELIINGREVMIL
jgi:DNA repair exonuclease SbcCD nuclease subunit